MGGLLWLPLSLIFLHDSDDSALPTAMTEMTFLSAVSACVTRLSLSPLQLVMAGCLSLALTSLLLMSQ